jgi:molecular chaperone GrpE
MPMEIERAPSVEAQTTGDVNEATAEAAAEDAETLRSRLAEANARADESHAKLLYALADAENFRKRNERYLQERLSTNRRTLLGKFLPVLDNLQRALAFEGDSEGLRQGLEATQRGFEALLASEDVKPILTVGEPFDPRFAEAVGTRESDNVPDNTVVEELQRGYKMGGEVLRPARVIVSLKRGAPEAEAAEASPY